MITTLIIGLCLLLVGCESTHFNPTDYSPATADELVSTSDNNIPGLWDQIRTHSELDHEVDEPAVQAEISWFSDHKKYFNRIVHQASPYLFYIYDETSKRHLPGELALIPLIESEYNPFAHSHAGAAGLWQLMPGTASGFGLKINWWYDGRRDLVNSSDAALHYLSYLHGYFNDWLLAIAAYDAGEGTVQAAINANKKQNLPTDYWHLDLPKETRMYVPKLLALAAIVSSPTDFNFELPTVDAKAYLEAVNVGSQIDLATAATLAGLDINTLRLLNPGYRRWATDPSGPSILLIPTTHVKQFKEGLAAFTKKKQTEWQHYVVKPGNSLYQIAKYHHTSSTVLRKVNHMNNDVLHVNDKILIPTTKQAKLVQPNAPHPVLSNLISENNLPGPQLVLYTVKRGDSAKNIAHHYGVLVHQINYWNNQADGTPLAVGTQLLIWEPAKHATLRQAREKILATHWYRVKPGDSLLKIAKHYHVPAKNLQKLNHLHHTTLVVGERIKIPHGVNVARSHPQRRHHNAHALVAHSHHA